MYMYMYMHCVWICILHAFYGLYNIEPRSGSTGIKIKEENEMQNKIDENVRCARCRVTPECDSDNAHSVSGMHAFAAASDRDWAGETAPNKRHTRKEARYGGI